MIAIAAAAVFVALFALWVVVPRFLIRRHESATPTVSPLQHEEFAPQAAD